MMDRHLILLPQYRNRYKKARKRPKNSLETQAHIAIIKKIFKNSHQHQFLALGTKYVKISDTTLFLESLIRVKYFLTPCFSKD